MKRTPVNTDVGILKGRDCIFLDEVRFADGTRTLILSGEINGNLCSQPAGDVQYKLTFSGVLALRIVELDSWSDYPASSFDEVLESQWIAELGGKVVVEKHRHFCVQTYDDVFDVICEGFEFVLAVQKEREAAS